MVGACPGTIRLKTIVRCSQVSTEYGSSWIADEARVGDILWRQHHRLQLRVTGVHDNAIVMPLYCRHVELPWEVHKLDADSVSHLCVTCERIQTSLPIGERI